MTRSMQVSLIGALLTVAACTPCLLPPPQQQQGSVAGCECITECGASVDDGYTTDWCYTADECGSYSWTRLAYFDWCKYTVDQTYESQTADAKAAWLWGLTSKCKTPTDWQSLANLFMESVKTIFDDVSDIMPAARTKVIHSVGVVAKVAFEPSGEVHPFSGLFKTGAKAGLLRLSTATPVDPDTPNITPGIGLKLLRDGVPSANVVAMPGLDGQADFNILARNYSNHLEMPVSWAVQLVAAKFVQASYCPLMVGLADMAAFEEDGTEIKDWSVPFELIFVPNQAISAFPRQPYSGDDFLAYAELGIDEGSVLFEVYARASPISLNDVHLGSIKSTSKFTRSTFGDTMLMFTHSYMERDLAKNPKWQKETNMEAACGVSGTHGRSATHEGRWRAGPPCPYSQTRSHDLPSSPRASPNVGHESACPFLRAQARQKELEEFEQLEESKRLLSTSSVALG